METTRIYILTCDKLLFFKTFKTLDDVLKWFDELNGLDRFEVSSFDSPQTRSQNKWMFDIICLQNKNSENREYFPFYIHCIDENGNQIELA